MIAECLRSLFGPAVLDHCGGHDWMMITVRHPSTGTPPQVSSANIAPQPGFVFFFVKPNPDPRPASSSPACGLCLHVRTSPSPAGNVCEDCGTVVAPSESVLPPALQALASDTGSRRHPVTVGLELAAEAAATGPPDACLQEWTLHLRDIHNQPREVLDGAYAAFRQAFELHPVTGGKGRALALVSLLWASRRLHDQRERERGLDSLCRFGNNPNNERYLLAQLRTPPRTIPHKKGGCHP